MATWIAHLMIADGVRMYRAASNVNDARKALKTQACPGIGHVRVAPPLL